MRQATDAVQKVCPSCSTLAHTDGGRCPYCRASYRRRRWPALLALAVLQAVLVLGGLAYMLVLAGDELDSTLDRRVDRVQRDLDRSFGDVQRSIREELDRRLPAESP